VAIQTDKWRPDESGLSTNLTQVSRLGTPVLLAMGGLDRPVFASLAASACRTPIVCLPRPPSSGGRGGKSANAATLDGT